MGTTTANLALYKPTAGESGWGSLVNANFDTLDLMRVAPVITGSGSWDSPTFVVDATNDRVGIGTASPTSMLHVGGTIVDPASAAVSFTPIMELTTTQKSIVNMQAYVRPKSAVVTTYGLIAIPTVLNDGGSSFNVTNLVGLFARLDLGVSYTGTVSNAQTVTIANPSLNGGSGVITTAYGLYVNAITTGGTNWGIYTASATQNHQLAGNVRVGATGTPSAALDVYGNVEISGPLPWIDLRAYGAVGNNVADDTAAITAALAAASSAGGARIYAPAGTYKTTGGHTLPQKTMIIGDGAGLTIFDHTGDNVCFTHDGQNVSLSYSDDEVRGVLKDFTIHGNTGSSAGGIELQNTQHFLIENVIVGGFGGDKYTAGFGLKLHNSVYWNENVRIHGFSSLYNATGILLYRSSGTNSFSYCRWRDVSLSIPASGIGLDVGGSGSACNLIVSDLDVNYWFQGNSSTAIYVRSGSWISASTRVHFRGETFNYTSCVYLKNAGIYEPFGLTSFPHGTTLATLDTTGATRTRINQYPVGTTTAGLTDTPNHPVILGGASTPESAVLAPVGSLYLRTDGGISTTLYTKTSGTGNTGWSASNVIDSPVITGSGSWDTPTFVVDSSNDRVGIGTASPAAKLHCGGTATDPTNAGVHLNTLVEASTSGKGLAYITAQFRPKASLGSDQYGLSVIPTVTNDGGTSNPITGAMVGVFARVDLAAAYTGTATAVRMIQIGNPSLNAGSGVITTAYGLFVNGITSGATNWGIFTNSATQNHQLAGNVRVGTAGTPATVLDVQGHITVGDTFNIALSTGTGTQIATATGQKVSFHGVTPVIQHATTGEATGFTAGAGTTVTHLSTFTGNTGSTAYTIADVVKALKAKGLMLA